MRQITLKINAGEVAEIAQDGNYVRIRSALVTLRIENPDASEVIEADQGDDFQFSNFQRLRISHEDAAEQTIKLIVSKNKKAGSSQVGGSVTIAGSVPVSNLPANQGAFTNTAKTVTNASASLVAANAARRYLEIQNKDAAGSIFVNVAGAAATTANGRKIGPGESWALSVYMPTGEVFAIGDAGSNANIVVIEG